MRHRISTYLALALAACAAGASLFGQSIQWQSLPDYSHAGYKGGDVPIPDDIPTKIVVSPGPGDDTSAIQNALDAVGAMPIESNGYRGAVLLTAGVYQVTTQLRMGESGVVLRGAGQGSTTIEFDGNQAQAFLIGGVSDDGWKTRVPGTLQAITTPVVALGSYSFTIADASNYNVGDEIIIWHEAESAWFESVDQGGVVDDPGWEFQCLWEDVRYRRIVTDIDGDIITVDAPVFMDLDSSLASLWVYKYDRPYWTENIGIEDFTCEIVTQGEFFENHAWHCFKFTSTDDSWARRVTAKHFKGSGFRFSGSVHCTVEDCQAIEPHSTISGARRYNFNTRNAQLILFKNCYANNARHAFVANGHSNDSGNVYLDCIAENNYTSSEGHQRWVTGLLYDNVSFTGTEVTPTFEGTVLLLGNRGDAAAAQGWSAANSVAWRCEATEVGQKIVVQEPPGTASNFAIGCIGTVSGEWSYPASIGQVIPADGIESWPRSLYEAQLAARLAWASDSTGPSVPSNVTATFTSASALSLTWDASIDPSGVASYRIHRDGVAIAVTSETSYEEAGLVPNSTHDYTVIAVDFAGNTSAPSAVETVVTVDDYVPPSAPLDVSAVAVSPFSVDLEWSEGTDDYDISFYRIFEDGVQVGASADTSFTVGNLSGDTTYSFTIQTVDLSGKVSVHSTAAVVSTPVAQESVDLLLALAFDELSGNTVFDESSNGNDGILTAGVDRTNSGQFDGALDFSGSGGQVDLGNLDIPGSTMTIAAWIKPDTFGISDARIISKASGVAESEHYWMLSTVQSGGIKLRFRLKTSTTATCTLVGATTLAAGSWTHVAASYDGSMMRIFINGQLDGSMARSGSIMQQSNVPVAIGDQPQGSRSFDGLIDDLRIYQRALIEPELAIVMDTSVTELDFDAPTVPGNLAANLVTDTSIQLSWNASTDNIGVAGYRIVRNGVTLGTTSSTSFTDSGLSFATSFEYRVAAYDEMGNESGLSNADGLITPGVNQAPASPQNVQAAAISASAIDVSWEPSIDNGWIKEYRIYRDSTFVGTSVSTSFTDSGLSASTNYVYEVEAVDDQDVLSGLSSPASATTYPPSQSELSNAVSNPGFEDGMDEWSFYTNGSGSASASAPGNSGSSAVAISIGSAASNIQLFQNNVSLEENTAYRLTFAAYSNSGRNFKVTLAQHSSPYTNYGLNREVASLGTSWQTFSMDFTTTGFGAPVNNGRLYFWLADDAFAGDIFYIDDVVLAPLEFFGPPDFEAPTAPSNLTAFLASDTSAQLNWDGSTDNVGVVDYQVSRNGAVIGVVSGNSFFDSGLPGGQTFNYSIKARDQAGNESLASNTVSVDTPIGNQPPTVPQNVDATGISETEIEISWSPSSDDGSISEYRVFRNGAEIGSTGATTFTDSGLEAGASYQYQVRAVDDQNVESALSGAVQGSTQAPDPGPGPGPEENVVANPGFENGMASWSFYTNGNGGASLSSPGYSSPSAVALAINSSASNIQLFQNGVSLEPDTAYRMTFAAYSNTGRDFRITLAKHSAPYTNYGLNRERVNLTTSWQTFTIDFTTTGFGSPVQNGRLYFWLASDAFSGDVYYIDNIVLAPISTFGPPDTESPTAPANLTAGLASDTSAQLDWDESSDNVGVVEYLVSRDGALIATVNGNGYLDTGLGAGQSYDYDVKARDAAGNESLPSNGANVTTPTPNQPPTTPSGLDAEGISESEISVSWSPSSDDGFVAEYHVYRDGAHIGTTGGTTFTDSGLEAGATHQYQTLAVDNQGAQSGLSGAVAGTTDEPDPGPGPGTGENVVSNPGFENGMSGWSFFTNGSGNASMSSPGYSGSNAIRLTINSSASNIQLFQNGVSLEPNTEYRLTFTAYSNTGRDFRMTLAKHSAPYTNYGLNRERVDLGPGWQTFNLDFTTTGFGSPVTNGRLYFWLASDAWAGDVFYIDDISLAPIVAAPPPEDPSTIEFWYGNQQNFGTVGVPQAQINLLGNVSNPEQIVSLSFAIDGIPQGNLSMGPEESIRLANPGDFNVEIPITDLPEGLDAQVTVTATSLSGAEYSGAATVNASTLNVWPLPYSIDWSEASGINDVAQVVDGEWALVPEGVRVLDPHYDRLIAIGDIEWSDFEITVPITVHSVHNQPAPLESIVGVLMRWDGHESTGGEQPGDEWRPIGAIGDFGWYEEGPHFEIFETGTTRMAGYNGMSLPLETPHIFKMRVETVPGQATGFYSFKVWPADQPEPNEWGITWQTSTGLAEGSLMLLAHYVDATFGDLVITSVESGSETEPPSAPQDLVATALVGGEISLSWTASTDNVGVDFYRVFRDDVPIADVATPGFVDSDVIAGTSYAYRVSAFDAAGNESSASGVVNIEAAQPLAVDPNLWLGLGFEEESGSLTFDISPNANDGTLTSGVGRSNAGKFDKALEFSGNGGQVDLDFLDIPSSTITIAAWILPDTFGVHDARIISKATGVNESDHFWMLSTLNSNGIKARARLKTWGNGTKTVVGGTDLQIGVWTHLAVTYDGSTLALFVNGVLDGSVTLNGTVATNENVPAAIGDQPEGGRSFDGLIDDVRIYLDALDAGELAAVMSESVTAPQPQDLEPPSSPGLLVANLVGDTEAQLNWNASSDNVGVLGYLVYRDGVEIGVTASTSYSDPDLPSSSTFVYTVAAFDQAGNESPPSNTASVDTPEGNQPPTVPQNVQASGVSETEINVSWDASSDDGTVVEYRILRDSIQIGVSSSTTYSDTGLAADSTHQYEVQAVDDEGSASNLSNPVSGSTLPSAGVNANNALVNGGFEMGLSSWTFYTNGSGGASAANPGFTGASAAVLTINNKASNIQLFQNGVTLQPNTAYRLSFAAYSNTGRNLRVSLSKQTSPYTNYGLNREVVDVTTSWQTHTIEFTTFNFNAPVNNANFYFWFAKDAWGGDVYYIDDVVLEEL